METEKDPQKEELETKVGQIVDRLIDLTEKGEISWKGGPHISGAYAKYNGQVFVTFFETEDWGIQSFMVFSEESKELKIKVRERDWGDRSNPIEKLDKYLFPDGKESKVEDELESPKSIPESEQLENASEILDSLK